MDSGPWGIGYIQDSTLRQYTCTACPNQSLTPPSLHPPQSRSKKYIKMSTMSARHLLIKSSASRNPVSRRTNASTADYSPDAARAELQTYADKIIAEGCTEEVFAKYATERSDCGSVREADRMRGLHRRRSRIFHSQCLVCWLDSCTDSSRTVATLVHSGRERCRSSSRTARRTRRSARCRASWIQTLVSPARRLELLDACPPPLVSLSLCPAACACCWQVTT